MTYIFKFSFHNYTITRVKHAQKALGFVFDANFEKYTFFNL